MLCGTLGGLFGFVVSFGLLAICKLLLGHGAPVQSVEWTVVAEWVCIPVVSIGIVVGVFRARPTADSFAPALSCIGAASALLVAWALGLGIGLSRLNIPGDELVPTWYLDAIAYVLVIGPVFWIPVAFLAMVLVRGRFGKK